MSVMTMPEVTALIGRTAHDRAGERIGVVESVYVDRRSGMPEWVTVSTGWFGTRIAFVPVSLVARPRPGDTDARIDCPVTLIRSSPHVDADGELSILEEGSIYAHYGLAHLPQPAGSSVADVGSESAAEAVRSGAIRRRLRRWTAHEEPDRS